MKMQGGGQRRLNVEPKRSQRGGRLDSDRNDGSYNRADASSPAGNRPSDGMVRGPRTFRGSNRGGGAERNDRGGHVGRGGGTGRGGNNSKP